MISEKHSQAARANGARSRGPVTPEGKAISARNATRHGMLAQFVVLPNEDETVFRQLFDMLIERFSPVDDIELSAIEEMAAAHWRSRRVMAIEHTLLKTALATRPAGPPLADTTAVFTSPEHLPTLTLLQRYETRVQTIYQRALRTLALLRKLPKQAVAEPAESEVEPVAPVPNEPSTTNVCNTEDLPITPPEEPESPFESSLEPIGTTVTLTRGRSGVFDVISVP